MRAPLLALAACLVLPAGRAGAEDALLMPLQPARLFAVEGEVLDDDGKVARDVSGIACAPPGQEGAGRLCLLVNDQDVHGQPMILDEGRLTAGRRIRLIPEQASPAILGDEPRNVACTGTPAGEVLAFKDLDGEAVAFSAPFFYIAGSHGCSRYRNEFRSSSFVLARVRLDDVGRVMAEGGPQASPSALRTEVANTFRLADVLRRAEGAGEQFGRNLHRDDRAGSPGNGLNLEGLVVASGTLFAGLRAPSLGGAALIVAVPVEPLFAAGDEPPAAQPAVLRYALGDGVGVRDLAPLPDGRLLVLAGAAQEQEGVAYTLHAVEPRPGGGAEPLATLARVDAPDGRPAKAEAVMVLGRETGALRVLVLFDGLPQGGPREYRVPFKD